MKKKILNILKYLSFLGLGVFLVWWSLDQIPDDKWEDFRSAFSTARYWLMVPVFFILLVSHILRAIRWRMLMLPMGYNPGLANTFFAVMIGYLANLAIPRLGEVLKCTILAKYENVPAEKLLGTIVAERAFDVVCLAIVFVIAFSLQFNIIGQDAINLFKKFFTGKTGNFDITKISIFIGAIIATILLARFLLKRFSHIRIFSTVSRIIKGIWQGIISVKDLKQKWHFVFLSVGIWVMYLAASWIGFYSTSGTAGLPLKVAVSGLAFASVGMIITPGGIGAYALFLARVLQKNGVPFELGFANGTLQWFAQFLMIILVGFLSLGLLPYFNKKTKKHEETGNHPV